MPTYLIRNYSESIEQLASTLQGVLRKSLSDELILVVPTNRKIRDLQRQLIGHANRRVSSQPNLYTLELLARKLYDLSCPPKQSVSKPLQAVLLQEAVREVHKQHGLKYFGLSLSGRAPRLSAGTFQNLLDVISTLKESGVYVDDLWREFQDLESSESGAAGERAKIEDLCRIYEAYEEKLGAQFIDTGGIYKDLTERLKSVQCEEILREAFPLADLMVINGFDEFSSPELRMISSLSGVKSLATLVAFDCYPENNELFGHLYENYKVLLEMGFSRVNDDSALNKIWIFNPPADQELARVFSTKLFQKNDQDERLDRADRITLFSARDRKEEVRLIAKTIKVFSQTHNEQDLSRICVATYQTQAYTPFVREVFSEYGIPVNITDRFYLSQSPIVIAILSLLDMVKNNFRRKDVLRATGSPYFRFEHGELTVDVANLHTVSTNLKLRIGAERWIERIEKRLLVLADQEEDVDGELDEEDIEKERTQLKKAREDILWLSSLLQPLRDTLKPADFQRTLLSLLKELKVKEELFNAGTAAISQTDLEKDLRAFQRFLLLLDELLEFFRLQGLSDEPLAIDFYVDQIRTAVQQLRYNVRQRAGYGVLVTSLEETRGIDFDVMFVAGLVDGEFPLSYQPQVFLSKNRQRKKELYHLTENRYLFYQGIRNFSEHLYISYPDRDGEFELVPSTFVDSLMELVKLEDARGNYSAQCSDKILSRSELLEELEQAVDVRSVQAIDRLREDVAFVMHARSVERSRYLTHGLEQFEGNIFASLSAEGREELARFQKKAYSISQLETYGKCPFKFFSERVLRLNALEEPEDGLTAREKGSVLHRALFEFYVNRRSQGLPYLDECSDQQFAEAVRDLTNRTEKLLDEIEIEDIFWQFDKEEILGSPTRPGIVQQLLSYERERRLEVRPTYFELSFGRGGRSARESDPLIRHVEPVVVGNLNLRGKVDRVEIGKDAFSIIDYKTGSQTATLEDIHAGLSLQLPLYLAAVETLMSESEGRPLKGVAGVYFMLREEVPEKVGLGAAEFKEKAFHVPKSRRPKLSDEEELRTIIHDAMRLVDSYIVSITRGEFPLTTEEKTKKVCPWCNFLTVCRIQSRQWIEKRQRV